MNLHFHSFQIPPQDLERRVRIFLPPAYLKNGRPLPVLYALDGQNLFERSTAFGGRHWKIPATMSKLPLRLQTIVVGIDNAGTGRIQEYAPFRRGQKGGGGETHLRFIIESLKPFMDKHYRTLPQRETTGIMGSSLGGLLALHAGLRFGEVFGRAGVLSPSLWFHPQVLQLPENPYHKSEKIWISGSKTESLGMESTLQKTYWTLRNGGYSDKHLRVAIRERGGHNEAFWGREFAKMQRWLFATE